MKWNKLAAVICLSSALMSTTAFAAEYKFQLDPKHSFVVWRINHGGFSYTTGKWPVNGTFDFDDQNPKKSKVDIKINMADIITVPELDKHLSKKSFFDVATYPTATFVSTKVVPTSKDTAKVEGTLTLHGVSKPVTLQVKMNKIGNNPLTQKFSVGISATAEIKRSDFGMYAFYPAIGDNVKLWIDAEGQVERSKFCGRIYSNPKLFSGYLLSGDSEFSNHILETEKVSKQERLAIYKNAYRLRLQEALAESFPILKKYLGSKVFDKLGDEYIKNFPSTFRSIRWFGDQFTAFLKSHKKYKKMPYLAELAQWEWLSAIVFDAENAEVISVEKMAAIPPDAWESVRFVLHPSLRRVNLSWNTVKIWEQLSEDKIPENPEQNPKPMPWIFWRKNMMCQYALLPQDEAQALDAVAEGKTFGDICEILCDFLAEDEVGHRAASFLKSWIISELVTNILI